MKNPRLSSPARKEYTIDEIVSGVRRNDRNLLSKAITYIESHKDEDRVRSRKILSKLIPHSQPSIRIGISGSPGVGKSSFIEEYGQLVLENKNKLAILAIDPSSQVSQGALLGDKTRMAKLSQHPNCFIRPTSTRNVLGGVAQHTHDVITLCESAGYNYILIETVGVGQSEINVTFLCDLFLLLLLPGAGDELQGIKRGIIEYADIFLVSKSDDERLSLAKESKRQLRNALQYIPRTQSSQKTNILLHSIHKPALLSQIYHTIEKRIDILKSSDNLLQKRKKQESYWLKQNVIEMLHQYFFHSSPQNQAYKDVLFQLNSGSLSYTEALKKMQRIIYGK